jgi:hypothetical protein
MKSILMSMMLILMSTACCWAQATEAEMRAFPMPPQDRVISAWNQEPYYGYFLRPTASRRQVGDTSATDYSYVLYAGPGLRGTTAVFWGTWGTTPIPPPDPSGFDVCGHRHVSYGVWALVQVSIKNPFTGNRTYNEFKFVGGGGLTGARNATGRCVFRTDVLADVDPRYSWGQQAVVIDLRGPSYGVFRTETYLYFVVGVLNVSHALGTCGAFACIEPGFINGYAVRP